MLKYKEKTDGINKKLTIFFNLTDTKKHGCQKNCSFCLFKTHVTKMKPSLDNIVEFLIHYKDKQTPDKPYAVLLTGGGDPLFNFEENKDYIVSIIKALTNLGYDILLQSNEIATINKYLDTYFADIKSFYFSTEILDKTLTNLTEKLLAKGKRVVLCKTVNSGSKLTEKELQDIEEYTNYYRHSCTLIRLHENYIHLLEEEDAKKLEDLCANYRQKKGKYVKFARHKSLANDFVTLVNDTVWRTYDYIHQVLLEETGYEE